MQKILFCALLLSGVLHATTPARVFSPGSVSSVAMVQQYYNNAVVALNEGNYAQMWQWYEQLDEDDKARFLNELMAKKTPAQIPQQVEAIKKKIGSLFGAVTYSNGWSHEQLFPKPAAASEPAKTAAKEKDVKGLAQEPEDTREFVLVAKNDDKTSIKISAEVLRKAAPTLYASVEQDKEAKEIPVITALEMPDLFVLVTILNRRKDAVPFKECQAGCRVEWLSKFAYDIRTFGHMLPQLAYAGRWIGSPWIEHATLWNYAKYLHGLGTTKIAKQINEDTGAEKLTEDMWPDIARYYFLQFDEEIEPLLWPKQAGKPQKWVYIDYPMLKAYGKFDEKLLKGWDIGNPEKPNFIVTTLTGGKITIFQHAWNEFSFADKEKYLKQMTALLKLKGLHPDLNVAGRQRALFYVRNPLVAQKLIEHGADVNFVADNEFTPLVWAASIYTPSSNAVWAEDSKKEAREMIELLIANGASVEQALKQFDSGTLQLHGYKKQLTELLREYLPKK